MRGRAWVALAGSSLVGVLLFVWPFVGRGAPGGTAAAAVGVGTAAALLGVEVTARRLDARGLALLASLAAIDAGARALVVTGIGGFSPIFLLILCGGYVFGPSYGFLLGATSLLVSALVTGGLGPWLPYQLFAAAWVGVAAGLAGLGRRGRPAWRDAAVLAGVGVVSGYCFGAAMDVWDWTFYRASPGLGFRPGMAPGVALTHFAHFYLATSVVYDTFRAVGNAVVVVALGLPVLVALARLRTRFAVEIVPVELALSDLVLRAEPAARGPRPPEPPPDPAPAPTLGPPAPGAAGVLRGPRPPTAAGRS
ncbi:MAG: ECF transporter S component [Acidimicrobiales bacterium]